MVAARQVPRIIKDGGVMPAGCKEPMNHSSSPRE
jgi:hypothetical protein